MKITVTQEEKKFKPFILSLEVESLDEYYALYNRFNITNGDIKQMLDKSYCECDSKIAQEMAYDVFSAIDGAL